MSKKIESYNKFYDRVYFNFRHYDWSKDNLATWIPRNKVMNEINSNSMQIRTNYESLFESFGRRGYPLSAGINCEHFHMYSQLEKFNPIIKRAEDLIKKTKNVNLEDLEIKQVCEIYGKKYGDKIIPPIFYKFGLILNYLIDLYPDGGSHPNTILEIGAGYGGLANLIMNRFKSTKYIIVDIEPILSAAATFLHKMDKKVVFGNEISVENFMSSDKDCLFLHPEQISQIPDKSIDLSINVDSLFEMPNGIAKSYLKHIDRVTSGTFYSNNRKKLHGSELTDTQEYQTLFNSCEYEINESDYLKHSQEEYEIIFQLTLYGGYKHELYRYKNDKENQS
jgi:hypothetical protein